MSKALNTGISVVIPSAGNSTRMGGANKQLMLLDNIPVLVHTVRRFSRLPVISEIIIVTRESDIPVIQNLADVYHLSKISKIIAGGDTRQESVFLGLKQVKFSKVLIHDGARPLVSGKNIFDLIKKLDDCNAAALGVPVKDTIKKVSKDGVIKETLNRSELVQIQTPQGFNTKIILDAHRYAAENNISATDDCMLAESVGIPVYIVPGEYSNIKVTTPEDILLCEVLQRQMSKQA